MRGPVDTWFERPEGGTTDGPVVSGIGMTGGGWMVAGRMLSVQEYDMGAENIHLRCAALTVH